MKPWLVGVVAVGSFAAGIGTQRDLISEDVSVECAAAHVAARWAQDEYGSSTHGIPARQTDEYRDAAFQEAFEHVKAACGGFDQPRDLWLRYGDLIIEHEYAAIDNGNPEFNPWYREVICPTFDNPEDFSSCQEDES